MGKSELARSLAQVRHRYGPDDEWVARWLAHGAGLLQEHDSAARFMAATLRVTEAVLLLQTNRYNPEILEGAQAWRTASEDGLGLLMAGHPDGFLAFEALLDREGSVVAAMMHPTVRAALLARLSLEVTVRLPPAELEAHVLLGDPPCGWTVQRLTEWLAEGAAGR